MPEGASTGSPFTQENRRVRVGWRISLFVLITMVVTGLAGVVLPAGLQFGSFALLLGALLGGWSMLALDGKSPDALGLYVERSTAREMALGTTIGVGIALVVVGVMAAAGGLTWSAQPGSAAEWVKGGVGALLLLTVPVAAEEALLRGYPLQALAEAVGAPLALVATSVAFGMMHMGNPDVTALGLANVTAAGLLLGAVYLRTGSLWWATGVHLGWNWAHGYLVDLLVSGLEILDAPLYEGASAGPDWLGGGAFGPEGSAVTTVVVLAASALVWWGGWLKPSETALRSEPLVFDGRNESIGS